MNSAAKILGALALLAAPTLAPVRAAQAQVPPPPSIEEAMGAICGQPARASRCVLEGREMAYWVAFPSVVEGRNWYTVVATAGDTGDEAEAPAAGKARISQVTYEASGGRWKQIARQAGFGSVFTNNSGNPATMIDSTGRPFVREIAGGVIIGQPITQMANEGITLSGYAMFRSAPDTSGRWLYGGDILAGSDNGASGCDEKDARQACYASRVTLAPTSRNAGSWPEMRANLDGTVVGTNGKVRSARPADAQVWRFDASQAAYTTDTRP